MALKCLIETTLLASLILGTAGCSGARSILRGQSPEDELPAPEVPVPVPRKEELRLPRVKMTERDQNALLSWSLNTTFAPLLGDNSEADWFVSSGSSCAGITSFPPPRRQASCRARRCG
jgi:hypothetical protein